MNKEGYLLIYAQAKMRICYLTFVKIPFVYRFLNLGYETGLQIDEQYCDTLQE